MVEQIEETKNDVSESSGVGSTALKAAAAAAAAGAAAIVARKALSHDSGGSESGRSSNGGSANGKSKSSGLSSGALGTIAAGGWEAARDALLPAAEDAAAAAGTFVGENAPDVVRDRIVPRFIESFNEARGGG
jgi:hypothetical protein